MLKNLRNFADTIFVKALIILIIFSFVFWGIGDIFRSSFSDHALKIGKQKISAEYVKNKTDNLREDLQRSGQAVPDDQQLQLQAVTEIIKSELIKLEAKELGINPGHSLGFSILKKQPNLQDVEGNFDQEKFENFLAINNLTEKEVFKNLHNQISSTIFYNAIHTRSISFPKHVEIRRDLFNEEKNISLIKIKLPKKVPATNPSESELVDFYTENKEEFLSPETREVEFIDFSCSNFSKNIIISKEEAKAEYEHNISNYEIAEQRELQQLFSDSEESITKAYEELQQGKKLQDIAANLNMKKQDISLGLQSKDQIYAGFVTPIFSASINQYTQPTKGPFGWHIFKILSIVPGSKTPYHKVKQEIIAKLKTQKACITALKSFNQAEDDLASGSTISDIASKNKLKLKNINLNKSNPNLPLTNLTEQENEKLVTELFSNSKVNQTIAKFVNQENFLLYNLKAINAERYLTIDEIKGILITKWQQYKHRLQYQNIAEEIYGKINESQSKKSTIKSLKYKHNFIVKKDFVSRTENNYPRAFLTQIFSLKDKKITAPFFDADKQEFLIALVNFKRIKHTSPGEKLFLDDKLKQLYLSHLNNDLLNSYLHYLMVKHKVVIKEDGAN